jgi:hypothetical protein
LKTLTTKQGPRVAQVLEHLPEVGSPEFKPHCHQKKKKKSENEQLLWSVILWHVICMSEDVTKEKSKSIEIYRGPLNPLFTDFCFPLGYSPPTPPFWCWRPKPRASWMLNIRSAMLSPSPCPDFLWLDLSPHTLPTIS